MFFSVAPVFGALFYLYTKSDIGHRLLRERTTQLIREGRSDLRAHASAQQHLEERDPQIARMASYIAKSGCYPVWEHTAVTYFPLGEDKFAALLPALRQAKHFIFLEYFIIEEGRMWDAILEILREKAEAQLDVRVMYDDLGSISKVSSKYDRKLRSYGINCVKFNPFRPILSAVHNNRDHRKIAVIDGVIGYTGGANLADEYINETHPFGIWKDAALRLEGEGVKSLTMMFLQNFDFSTGRFDRFEDYLPKSEPSFRDCGWVQAFGDGPKPWSEEQVGENAYLNLINQAKHKLYVMTPYLIADHTLMNALILAARRGVDVRVVTPHIPDKRAVYWLTRSNYAPLIEGGVKIYEFTPGFIHSKVMLSDDTAIVGTINLDYRSLVHHLSLIHI